MKKILLWGVMGIILLPISFIIYSELVYSPLGAVDTRDLLGQKCSLKKMCSIDFLGFSSRGECFDLYKYKVGVICIDNSFPATSSWEGEKIPESAIVSKWKHCPLDSLSFERYEFIITVNNFSEYECSKTFNASLKNPENYYSYFYINELEQYFLLYNVKEQVLYYLRKKGF